MQHLFTPPSSDREDEDDESINSIINELIINELMNEMTEQIVSSNETEYVFNHGDHIFSQDFPGQELTEWDNDPPGLWSAPTVRRNLLNEFNAVVAATFEMPASFAILSTISAFVITLNPPLRLLKLVKRR